MKEILQGVAVGLRHCAANELAKWFYETHDDNGNMEIQIACYNFLEDWNGRNQDPLPLYELMAISESQFNKWSQNMQPRIYGAASKSTPPSNSENQKSVTAQINFLQQNVRKLEDIVKELFNILNPIMKESEPENNVKSEILSGCSLAQRINNINEEVKSACASLSNMIKNCDL